MRQQSQIAPKQTQEQDIVDDACGEIQYMFAQGEDMPAVPECSENAKPSNLGGS
jgi:hypothetical protein